MVNYRVPIYHKKSFRSNEARLGDVVAGAGIGIASTKFAYWLYPKIKQYFYKNKPVKTILIPSYQHGALEMGLIHKIRLLSKYLNYDTY